MARRFKNKAPKVSNVKPMWMNNQASMPPRNESSRKMEMLKPNIWYSHSANEANSSKLQNQAKGLLKEMVILTQNLFLTDIPSIRANCNWNFKTGERFSNAFQSLQPFQMLYSIVASARAFAFNIISDHTIYNITINSVVNATNDNYARISIIQFSTQEQFVRYGQLRVNIHQYSSDIQIKLAHDIDILIDCSKGKSSFEHIATDAREYQDLFGELLKAFKDNFMRSFNGNKLSLPANVDYTDLFSVIISQSPHGYVNDNVIKYLKDRAKNADTTNDPCPTIFDIIDRPMEFDDIDCMHIPAIDDLISRLHLNIDDELFADIPLLDFNDHESDWIINYCMTHDVYCNSKQDNAYNLKEYIVDEQRFGLNFRKNFWNPSRLNNDIQTTVFTYPIEDTNAIDFVVLHNAGDNCYTAYILHYNDMTKFNPINVDSMYIFFIIDKEHGGKITFSDANKLSANIVLDIVRFITSTMIVIHDHPELNRIIVEQRKMVEWRKPKPDDLTEPKFVIRRIIRTQAGVKRYIKENASKVESGLIHYTLEEWSRRAHIRKLKDGREILVKASKCHRHKPLSDIEIHLKL